MFKILNALVTDTGRYVCVAENVAGSAEKYFNLNVHGEFYVIVSLTWQGMYAYAVF